MEKTRFGFLGRVLYWKFSYQLQPRKHAMLLDAITKCNTLLDAGCSTGLHSIRFDEKANRLIGLDIAKSGIKAYRERFGKRALYIVASLDCLPFQPNSLDAVVLQDSLEHTEHAADSLGQIWLALKPKGVIVATVPNWYNRFFNVNPYNVKSHHHFHSSIGWLTLFVKAGFQDCVISSVAFPILDMPFLSRFLHLFGVIVVLKAHKTAAKALCE